jgi:hypothetical protein
VQVKRRRQLLRGLVADDQSERVSGDGHLATNVR